MHTSTYDVAVCTGHVRQKEASRREAAPDSCNATTTPDLTDLSLGVVVKVSQLMRYERTCNY